MKPIVIEDVTWTYKGETRPSLKNINLEVEEGEFIGIIGPNLAGKTTFCYLLNGLIPDMFPGQLTGNVYIFGQNTRETDPHHLAKRVGLVFQDPEIQLTFGIPYDECAFGPENLGVQPEEIKKRVESELLYVDLWERRNDATFALSGGMKQRLAIAAVLAMHPDVLVMDEPTSNLDPVGAVSIFNMIKRLKKERKMTALVVEHKICDLIPLVDRILVIYDGEIIRFGKPREVLEDIDLLLKVGIEPPRVTLISHSLKQARVLGSSIPTFLTVEEAFETISKLLDSKRK